MLQFCLKILLLVTGTWWYLAAIGNGGGYLVVSCRLWQDANHTAGCN